MGNLGAYQAMTTVAKKVGGPKNLAVLTVAGGWAVLRVAEAGGKKAVAATRVVLQRRSAPPCATQGQVFEVTADGTDGSAGLTLRMGDSYRVLECDADSILVEVLDNPANPYFLSRQFSTTVSDFPAEDVIAGD